MPKKQTAKKVSKKKAPARKVRKVLDNLPPTPKFVTDPLPEGAIPPTLAPVDPYHKADEEAKARVQAKEAEIREKIMEVEKKIFEDAISQARELLDSELALALEAMRERAAKGGRELELLAVQEAGYLAYVLTAEVARTVNRVRPDVRCEDLLALVKRLPR